MISFIIPAHNEASVLKRTLETLAKSAHATGEPYEIIVVDDESTDYTSEIATQCGARVVSVNLRQISAVRNAGAINASGDRFVFVDADTLVPESTLCAALRALERGVAGGGCGVELDGDVPFYAEVALSALTVVFRSLSWAAGCFLFCRRDAFISVGGFDERLFASEEVVLSSALKRKGRFVILRETVITSGRKLRQYSGMEIIATFLRIIIKGPFALTTREGLDLWYKAPRETTISD